MLPTHADTEVISNSPWARLAVDNRRRLVSLLWLITEMGLIAGAFIDARYWIGVVAFSVAHAALSLALTKGRAWVFPTQLRIAYALWVLIGTAVPSMVWMMYVTTVGLAANLIWGYCLLSRCLYLLPWNRTHALTWRSAVQTFVTRPGPGRFHLPVPSETKPHAPSRAGDLSAEVDLSVQA